MIYIGADYAGYPLKKTITEYFTRHDIPFVDVGTGSGKKKNDFTDFIPPVVGPIKKSSKNKGILICGTGYGMVIGANRFRGIRATLADSVQQAKWSRTHDNANILVLAAWRTAPPIAPRIIRAWLNTPFQPYARRVRRFKKIDTWPK